MTNDRKAYLPMLVSTDEVPDELIDLVRDAMEKRLTACRVDYDDPLPIEAMAQAAIEAVLNYYRRKPE